MGYLTLSEFASICIYRISQLLYAQHNFFTFHLLTVQGLQDAWVLLLLHGCLLDLGGQGGECAGKYRGDDFNFSRFLGGCYQKFHGCYKTLRGVNHCITKEQAVGKAPSGTPLTAGSLITPHWGCIVTPHFSSPSINIISWDATINGANPLII